MTNLNNFEMRLTNVSHCTEEKKYFSLLFNSLININTVLKKFHELLLELQN